MPTIEQISQFWVPTFLLILFTYLAIKYLDRQQKLHNELAKEKMLLEVWIRQKESTALINWIDLLIGKVTNWNKEILDSNKSHSEEHRIIIKTLKERYWKTDLVRIWLNNDIKSIKENVSDIKNILKK